MSAVMQTHHEKRKRENSTTLKKTDEPANGENRKVGRRARSAPRTTRSWSHTHNVLRHTNTNTKTACLLQTCCHSTPQACMVAIQRSSTRPPCCQYCRACDASPCCRRLSISTEEIEHSRVGAWWGRQAAGYGMPPSMRVASGWLLVGRRQLACGLAPSCDAVTTTPSAARQQRVSDERMNTCMSERTNERRRKHARQEEAGET